MTDIEQKLYAQIGLLSTQFASIEHQVQEILARYITHGDSNNMLVGLILDKDNLEKKLQHLEKAVLFELHKKQPIRDYISKVREQKSLRNSFIHGSWFVSSKLGNDVIGVYHNTVTKFYPISSGNDPDNPGWQMGTETYYTLKNLQEINERIKGIYCHGQTLIKEMDNGEFEFF